MVLFLWSVFALLYTFSMNCGNVASDISAGSPNTETHKGRISNTEEWITQVLDHFNPTMKTTWRQRYFNNSANYVTGGPIFIFLGGEGQVDFSSPQNVGFMMKLAEEHHAAAFMLEHRYYGDSKPTPDVNTENLKYLTIDQALADVAYFVTYLKEERSYKENKAILFGCSYAGNLAAWARMKYPHLIHAAVTSGAPVRAKVEFYQYYKKVSDILESNFPGCSTSIRNATREMKHLLKTERGVHLITKEFRLCQPLNSSDKYEVATLFQKLAQFIATVVQYNVPVDSSHNNVWLMCSYLTNASYGAMPLYRYSNLLKKKLGSHSCFSIDVASWLNQERNISWDGAAAMSGERQYMYQKCMQFGHFQTSKSTAQPFGEGMFSLEYRLHFCKQIFERAFSSKTLRNGVKRVNILYGDKNHYITNVIFTYGSQDPWNHLGMKNKKFRHENIIFVKGASHCSDLSAATSFDSPQLVRARQKINDIVSLWLKSET